MTMKAEIRVMQLQAKECQQPPKAGGGTADCPLEPLEGAQSCQHFNLGPKLNQ